VTSYLEIEHYEAKTVAPARAFAWENLFPVCRLCNGSKGDADHGNAILKPDVEDPESLLWLHPDTGKLQAAAGIGAHDRTRVEQTLDVCRLQRGGLCSRRIETMERTIHWLERVAASGRTFDAALRDEWERLSHPAAEFKFVIRHVLETRGEPRLAAWDRRRFEGA
jgi:hypothetical protein